MTEKSAEAPRTPSAIRQREWREKNPEHRAAYNKVWKQQHPEAVARHEANRPKNRREPDPVKRRARAFVDTAIRWGRLRRMPCERCGATRTHGHHDDYSRPLDVRWLCSPCHAAHHAAERKP